MRLASAAALLAAVLASALPSVAGAAVPAGADVRGKVAPLAQARDTTYSVHLNDGERQTFTRPDGSFVFFNVEPGTHTISVASAAQRFAQIVVTVAQDGRVRASEAPFPGGPRVATGHPVVVKALGPVQLFEVPEQYNVLSMLKNPMVLLMAVSLGLMVCLPKMAQLDPEAMKEIQQQQQQQQDPQAMLRNMLGMSKEDDDE